MNSAHLQPARVLSVATGSDRAGAGQSRAVCRLGAQLLSSPLCQRPVPSPWPCPAAPGAPPGAAAEARGPNEDWSWDITYLPTNVRGVWLFL